MARANRLRAAGRSALGAMMMRGVRGRRLALCLAVAGLWLAVQTPGRAWAHVTEVMPDAVAEMEYQILLDFQPEKVDVRNKLAMVLYRKKKFKEAEAELRIVLAAEPNNFNALDSLGLVMSQTERLKEAVPQFLLAIKANPQDVFVHYHLGQAYAGLGEMAAAGKSFSEALALANQPAAIATPTADLDAIRKALAQIGPQAGQPSTAQ